MCKVRLCKIFTFEKHDRPVYPLIHPKKKSLKYDPGIRADHDLNE